MDKPISHVDLLHRISNIIASERSLEEMLGEVIGLTVQVTGCDACLVYLFDQESGEVTLHASQVPHVTELGRLSIKIGEGVTGWVAEHRAVVALSANASADKRFKRFAGLVEDTYEAFLSVPLVSAGDLIGVINVHHRDVHEHDADEIGLLTFIGEQMGGAVAKAELAEANAKLLDEAEDMKRQLETRKIVERAKGILQRAHGLTEEDAYLRLRNESRRMRRPMRDLAEAIILSDDVSRAREGPALPAPPAD